MPRSHSYVACQIKNNRDELALNVMQEWFFDLSRSPVSASCFVLVETAALSSFDTQCDIVHFFGN